jgi:hypothetical protein
LRSRLILGLREAMSVTQLAFITAVESQKRAWRQIEEATFPTLRRSVTEVERSPNPTSLISSSLRYQHP